jgi:hypothetical protein
MLARGSALGVRYRGAVLLIGALLFTGGLWLSIADLDAGVDDLIAGPLFLNLCVLAPSALLLSAWGLNLTALTIGRTIGFADAIRATALGTITELLPVPGGLIARSAALARAGAPPVDIVHVLSLNGFLWLGLLALMASVALLIAEIRLAALALAAIGFPAVIFSLLTLKRRAPGRLVLCVVLAHRLLSLIINVLRMATGFAALGAMIGAHEAMVVTAANSLGSFSTAIPSGLGVGEALAALAAVATTQAPALAFTVAALNRLCYLMTAGGSAILATARRTR